MLKDTRCWHATISAGTLGSGHFVSEWHPSQQEVSPMGLSNQGFSLCNIAFLILLWFNHMYLFTSISEWGHLYLNSHTVDYPKEGEFIGGIFQLMSLIQSIQLIKTTSFFFISIVCLAPHLALMTWWSIMLLLLMTNYVCSVYIYI